MIRPKRFWYLEEGVPEDEEETGWSEIGIYPKDENPSLIRLSNLPIYFLSFSYAFQGG